MRKRNHQIIVRLDDEELLMLKRKIHRSDLTMAEYFRDVQKQERCCLPR